MLFKIDANPINEPVFLRIQNNINSETVASFEKSVMLCGKIKQKILPVLIDSNGGCAYALISLYENIKNSKIKIATIVESKALSCAAILLSCGHKGYRYMAPDATVMFHDVKTTYSGKTDDVKADAKETERLNRLMYKILDNNCCKSKNFFREIMKNNRFSDLYLNSSDCLEYNIVDHIGIPTFKMTTKYKLSL